MMAGLVKGSVSNPDGEKVSGASCLIFSMPDSVFYDYAVTDNAGLFEIKEPSGDWYLSVSCSGFVASEIKSGEYYTMIETAGKFNVILQPSDTRLDEVTIVADNDQLSMKDGVITYGNLNQLRKSRVLSNAHDLLQALPLITSADGNTLTLTGAPLGSVIYINGRRPLMGGSELMQYLKNLRAEQVEDVEIIYTPDPKWKTRSSVINIKLKNQQSNTFNGQIFTSGSLKHNFTGRGGSSVFMGIPKFNFHLNYSINGGTTLQKDNTSGKHNVEGEVYDVSGTSVYHSKFQSHNIYAQAEYIPDKSNTFGVAYNGSFAPNNKNLTDTFNSVFGIYDSENKSSSCLHAISLYYSNIKGVAAGFNYNHYDSSSSQDIKNISVGSAANALTGLSNQKVNSIYAYFDMSSALPHKWMILYGANHSFIRNYNRIINVSHTAEMEGENKKNTSDENKTELYFGIQKNFMNGKIFMRGTLKGEYHDTGDDHTWQILPTALVQFRPTNTHMFQFSFQSYRNFPSLWQRQDFRSYLNPYVMTEGNPRLRPTKTEMLSVVYIFKQKYTVNAYYAKISDYYCKQPYQSPDKLIVIYKTSNVDFYSILKASLTIPINIGEIFFSKIIVGGEFDRSKASDWHGMEFDRSKFTASLQLYNTFVICRKPKISFEVNGSYRSPMVRCLWDIGTAWSLNTGLACSFLNDNLSVRLRGFDLFETSQPLEKIRFGNQNRDVDSNYYNRSFSLEIAWKFGGYKNIREKRSDTSRYGIN